MENGDNTPMIGGQEQREDNSPMLSSLVEEKAKLESHTVQTLLDYAEMVNLERVASAMQLSAQEFVSVMNAQVNELVEWYAQVAIEYIRQINEFFNENRALFEALQVDIENNQRNNPPVQTGMLRRSIPYTRRK